MNESKRARVFVVEDDPDVARQVARTLQEFEFVTQEFRDGAAVLRRLRSVANAARPTSSDSASSAMRFGMAISALSVAARMSAPTMPAITPSIDLNVFSPFGFSFTASPKPADGIGRNMQRIGKGLIDGRAI